MEKQKIRPQRINLNHAGNMLELSEITAQALRVAIDSALAEGADAETVEQVIQQMVAERIPQYTVQSPDDIAELLASSSAMDGGDKDEVIYEPGELPDGLITLPEACAEHGIKPNTANFWLRNGDVTRYGSVRVKGGKTSVVSRQEFSEWTKNRRKRGRPRKWIKIAVENH